MRFTNKIDDFGRKIIDYFLSKKYLVVKIFGRKKKLGRKKNWSKKNWVEKKIDQHFFFWTENSLKIHPN